MLLNSQHTLGSGELCITRWVEPTLRKEIATSYALWLYQQDRVTLAKAAELAGLDLYDFMQVCKQNRIAVIDVSRMDLEEELSGFTAA